MKTEYYVYVSIGYTGRHVKCSRGEFNSVLEMAESKFDIIKTEGSSEYYNFVWYYACVDYGVNDGIVHEQIAMKKTLK